MLNGSLKKYLVLSPTYSQGTTVKSALVLSRHVLWEGRMRRASVREFINQVIIRLDFRLNLYEKSKKATASEKQIYIPCKE